MLHQFILFEALKVVKYFKTRTLAKLITLVLFLAVFAFVGLGIYYYFISGFRYILFQIEEPAIIEPLFLFLYEVAFLVLSGVVVLSATITAVFNLFKGKNNEWLISSPSFTLFPHVVLLRSLASSFVPLLILFIPALFAVNKMLDLGFVGLTVFGTALLSLFVILNVLSSLVVVLLAKLYVVCAEKVLKTDVYFGWLIAIIVAFYSTIVAFVWRAASRVDLLSIFKADQTDVPLTMYDIGAHFMLFPSHFVASSLLYLQSNSLHKALVMALILVVASVLSCFVWKYAAPLFYRVWLRFQEGATQHNSRDVRLSVDRDVSFGTTPFKALFKKEAIIASRNLKGLMWILFLLSIWAAEIAINILLNNSIKKDQTDVSPKIALIQAFQFVIALYFIASFTLRFVFPSFSAERKTAWITATAPVRFSKIFFGKYLFYSITFSVIGCIMSFVHTVLLPLSFTNMFATLSLFVTVVICIVTLGLCMGTLFPNRETDDPEVISTSMPGLIFTALSLSYGALASFILYVALLTSSYYAITYMIVGTYGIVAALLYITIRNAPQRVFGQ